MTTARLDPTMTLLQDGRVLVVGGKDDTASAASIASAEIFDPATERWSSAGELKTARQGHTATLLPDGRVVIAGATLLRDGRVIFIAKISVSETELTHDALYRGLTNGDSALTAELWETNRWGPIIHLTTGRYDHVTVLLPRGKLLVLGGTTGGLVKTPVRLRDDSAPEDDRAAVRDARLRRRR